MLTAAATPELVAQWKRTYETYHDRLHPNRKTGEQILAFLRERYPLKELSSETAKQVVAGNVLSNDALREQLPEGAMPVPVCFLMERTGAGAELYGRQDECFTGLDIFAGIDLSSGWFCVEGSSLLWDELYAFRGLNEKDLENTYSVAEYIACLKRFGKLESVLAQRSENG